jgi:hypothetical protein
MDSLRALYKTGKRTGIRPLSKMLAKFKKKARGLGMGEYPIGLLANSRKTCFLYSLTNKYLASFEYDDISKRYEVLYCIFTAQPFTDNKIEPQLPKNSVCGLKSVLIE